METSFFERIKGYKTITVNALAVLGSLLVAFGVVDIVPSASDIDQSWEQIVGGLGALWGGANIWLRFVTDSAIFSKD